uniref:ABC transporter substrate-binding protein n=1 Tax=Candidatus Planktophila sp. TaxID=2175601 RepID=UPI00404B04E7
MQKFNRATMVVAVAVASLVLAGCSSDSNSSSLKIGSLLPETGSLAFLGPPEFAGVDLAVEEINAAGGVLGEDIEHIRGD